MSAEKSDGTSSPVPSVSVCLPTSDATEDLGARLASLTCRGDVIFLCGELGAGKTCCAKGFLRSFFSNPSLEVPSPSYLLCNTYADDADDQQQQQQPISADHPPLAQQAASLPPRFRADRARISGVTVHHIDSFRLPVGRIAAVLDFSAIFANNISLIEWPERLGPQLVTSTTPPRLEVHLEGVGPQAQGRTAVLKGVGERWEALVESWRQAGGPPGAPPMSNLAIAQPADSSLNGPSGSERPLGENTAASDEDKRERDVITLPEDPSTWLVLGIESSCDDTGAAVIRGDGRVLGEALASQSGVHEQWGGVKPDAAQACHKAAIDGTVDEALRKAGVEPSSLHAVAVTVGPGLSLCLQVGVKKALQLASTHRLPLVRVHHMEAHAMVTRLPQPTQQPNPDTSSAPPSPGPPVTFPALVLLVSGGHNMAVLAKGIGQYKILGSTLDDSIGEAFDKTARLLGIDTIPGGPLLERLADQGDPNKYAFSLPFAKSRNLALRNGCDYSFSGLKTQVRELVNSEIQQQQQQEESEGDGGDSDSSAKVRADIAASFQSVIVSHLLERATRAIAWAQAEEPSIKHLVVAGGVAANKTVRSRMKEAADNAGLTLVCPPPRLCTDNGVMVAWTGLERLRLGLWDVPPVKGADVDRFVEVCPRWPLGQRDARSTPKPGGGGGGGGVGKANGQTGGEKAAKKAKKQRDGV
ncbi:unnamed protein product [Vitrella brassicaformis CCMP3155]|uniref:N(6)-L-threonylcarbamoyladenine synthase n=3 Tax=Vitrella brassicaformis TaxID=1169539 RepID=A0A0G4EZU4_VITBC|nr:unnamed protein product [Vitrella brassicaformis CCMP3155]|eukprot:CEM04675.1 unnamed protein product [Vitrella brassicaformis CCMP3155]